MTHDDCTKNSTCVDRVMVATDRSESAERAVLWAASLAGSFDADLYIVQVVVPEYPARTERGAAEHARASYAAEDLTRLAHEVAGPRGHARVVVDEDPARAIISIAEERDVDTLVVGNVGMSGRKEFLLGNVPNRITHNARCNVIIFNSTTTQAEAAPKQTPRRGFAGALANEEEVEQRRVRRANRVAMVMAKHGVKEAFTRSDPDTQAKRRRRATSLRTALEELGPVYCKIGQVLSTRPDLLQPEYIAELATLQDSVPPLAEDEVVSVMERELGVPWEDTFASLDPTALAAGTIAQVHRATLNDGSRVVVKVQRPGARDDIMQDLGLLEVFARNSVRLPAIRRALDVPAFFESLSESLVRELDFRQEAQNMERMSKVFAGYQRLGVPSLYKELSSSRLLVMQEVQGGPIREAPQGPVRKEAAKQLLEGYYRQVLTEGFLHADPHPGNLMWWNDRIYFLDFGMVGELGPGVRDNLILLLLALWQEDVAFVTDIAVALAGGGDHHDLDVGKYQSEIGRIMARYRSLSVNEIQLGPMLQELSSISIKHELPLPPSLLLSGKALAQVQLTVAELDPELEPFEVAGEFLMHSVNSRARERLSPQTLFYEGQKLSFRVTRLVEAIERLSGARPGPELQASFTATRLENAVRRAGRRLANGVVAGAALIGAAISASSSQTESWVPAVLLTISAVFIVILLADLLRPQGD